MDQILHLQVHGKGNAWPVFLGTDHPFYDRLHRADLSNAAFSLYLTAGGEVISEVLIDSGHGTLQSLIGGRNRIPECICLTHAHMDHTLGVDWLVQSHRRGAGEDRPYPVYASQPVFDMFISSYPHLEKLIRHVRLEYGSTMEMDHAPGFRLTAFPVYHGKAAAGASMLLFESLGRKVLFTGDLLSTLLRKRDLDSLAEPDILVADTNNRFPWPRTNHWSVTGRPGPGFSRGPLLARFTDDITWEAITAPHRPGGGKPDVAFLDELKGEGVPGDQSFTLLEFLTRIGPARLMPVHYSGTEDMTHHGEPVLNKAELEIWVKQRLKERGIPARLLMPESGEIFDLD